MSGKRKLIVFVPREALENVRDALFAAGAGRIGDYERCSWYTAGTGTFLGGAGTDPAIGEAGRACRRAPPRDGLPGGATRRRHRGAPACTPIRGARVRRLPAPVKARLSTDGGARGNPGPAAFAYVLE